MNILVVCEYGLYRDLSYSFVHNQAREYAALGHRVRVICPNAAGKRGRGGGRLEKPLSVCQEDGVEIFDIRYVTLSRYGERHFNTVSAKGAVRLHWKRIMDDFVPDVIHAHTLGFDSRLGAWLKKRLNCPLVVTTHGSDTMLPLQRGDTESLRRNCDQADAVVAVSSQLCRNLAGCGTKTRLLTINNGYVPHPVDPRAVRDPWALIQVGNLVPGKRVDVTIRAFAKLKETYPAMSLTVVGEGPQRESLERLCVQLGVADSVRFTGRLTNSQVFDALSRSACFVMVSKPEGFGIVYLEAMAAGCVVIGTEGQGIADVIEPGVNGFLVPADEPEAIVRAVSTCVQDADLAARLAENGRIRAAELTWTHNAECVLSLFDQLIKKQ